MQVARSCCPSDLAAIVVARADLSPVVVDVGDHRLKDFDRTEHLYQFGDVTFPPIRSIGTLSLPDAASSFVGRDNDLYEALSIMLEERPRLLTIRGPGGVGKTRFSIELARTLRDEHPGGTFFVELAPLTDPSTVLAEVAKAIGVTGPTPDAEAIAERVGLKDTLVLLDNAEHVLGTAKDLAILLQLAPALSIIMTSRSPMAITAERVFELSPMPDDMSVTLFLDRARTSGRIVERSSRCGRAVSAPGRTPPRDRTGRCSHTDLLAGAARRDDPVAAVTPPGAS